jgi:hypothetical protein
MYYLKLVSALQLLSACSSDFYVLDKMKVLDFLANESPLSQPFGGIYCAEILFTRIDLDVIGTVGMMKDSTGLWGTGISTGVSVGKA